MLIDSHIHLQDIKTEKVRASLLSRARELAVGRFVCNGTRPEDWPLVREIAQSDDRVVPFYGVHPWFADKVVAGWDAELEHFLSGTGAGIGEIGLDRVKNDINFARQTEIFHRQLEIAGRLGRPFAVHCARAGSDILGILKRDPSRRRFMVHSYHGSYEMLRNFLDLGAYISFSWKILSRGTEETMDLVRQVPLDRLLLETDFPYTQPGKLSPEATVEDYCECLGRIYALAAQTKGISEEKLQDAVWKNGTVFLSGTAAQ
ncbi:MAG: TatD family hydrolase [Candidatus Omnitrophica bacterium]|nr:TatD family hydrolase [Candidatus Omnitrophota bacterium]